MHLVLADGVYVNVLNLESRLQNQIRCMDAFDNSVFYKIRDWDTRIIIFLVWCILEKM